MAIGSPVRAADAATRTTSHGSVSTRTSRASATSPACSTTPSASGRRTGERRNSPVSPRVDRAEQESLIAWSVVNAMVRAASPTTRARPNRSSIPSAFPIWSPYSACSTSRARPEARCSSVRASRTRACALSHCPGRVARASHSCASDSAATNCTSRSPPAPFFRSGSVRWAITPARWRRAAAAAITSSNREAIWCRHCRRAPSTTRAPRSASPATTRASSRLSPAHTSEAATARHWSTVRTLWSRPIPESHSGYQSESARAARSRPGRLSWTSTRSRSEYGSTSRRPRPPRATSANPDPSPMPASEAMRASSRS